MERGAGIGLLIDNPARLAPLGCEERTHWGVTHSGPPVAANLVAPADRAYCSAPRIISESELLARA